MGQRPRKLIAGTKGVVTFSNIIEGRESILLSLYGGQRPAIHVLRFHSLCTAGLVVLHTDLALLLHLLCIACWVARRYAIKYKCGVTM